MDAEQVEWRHSVEDWEVAAVDLWEVNWKNGSTSHTCPARAMRLQMNYVVRSRPAHGMPWPSKMTPEQQAVYDAQVQLKKLEHEHQSLLEEERQINDRLKAISARRSELRPYGYRSESGQIALARARLAHAQRELADANKPRMEISRGKYTHPPTVTVVLVKVTDKRIYVREVGGDREHFISKDGKAVPYGWQVDMDALLKWADCAQEAL